MKFRFTWLFLFIFFIAGLSFIAWYFDTKKPINIFFLDKTVLKSEGIEHQSAFWVLNKERYVKPDSTEKTNERRYDYYNDYFGFFPLKDRKFKIKDLENYSSKEVKTLSKKYDMAYYTDTYGMYKKEWHHWKDDPNLRKKRFSDRIYGGLTNNEFLFLKSIKEQKKLVLMEFNTIAEPTPLVVRRKVEREFDIKWSGWVGKHFFSLDTTINKEIESGYIRDYEKQSKKEWEFKKSGLIFFSRWGKMLVLEDSVDLKLTAPVIRVRNDSIKNYYNLEDSIGYSYWFDITTPTNKEDIIATYEIYSTEEGKKKMKKQGIPLIFPAVIGNPKKNRFYYFAGDFADNSVSMRFSYFKHSQHVGFLQYFFGEKFNKARFFWKFYYPMMKRILADYYKNLEIVEQPKPEAI